MTGKLKGRTLVVCAATALLTCALASAQYGTDFEPPLYSGSPDGVGLAGQDLFYIPTASTPSTDCYVYTYAGNPLGIPANPGGGEQFVGATGLGDGSYARGQRTEDGTWGDMTGRWTASFDIAAAFLGTAPSAQNLGSWSTQPLDDPLSPTQAGFIALAQWTDETLATNWDANYLAYDAGGAYVYPEVVPDPAFQNLPINHWYRWSTTVDFDTNLIVRVAITDLTTGDTASYEPVDWYLAGGAAGGLPGPPGFRLFAGAGSVYGNTLAFDNVAICPDVSGDLDYDGDVDLSDLAQLLSNYGTTGGATYEDGDLDGDGDVDLSDLAALLAVYGTPVRNRPRPRTQFLLRIGRVY